MLNDLKVSAREQYSFADRRISPKDRKGAGVLSISVNMGASIMTGGSFSFWVAIDSKGWAMGYFSANDAVELSFDWGSVGVSIKKGSSLRDYETPGDWSVGGEAVGGFEVGPNTLSYSYGAGWGAQASQNYYNATTESFPVFAWYDILMGLRDPFYWTYGWRPQ